VKEALSLYTPYKQKQKHLHKKGNRKFMQPQDTEIQKAIETIKPQFADKYGRPKKTPYYITQLQTLFEKPQTSS